MNRTKTTMRIAVVAALMAVVAFAAKPAQAAKFTLLGSYKYVGLSGEGIDQVDRAFGIDLGTFHGGKVHFLWSVGNRHDENRAQHLLGFGVGAGAGEGKTTFFDVSLLNYEYIFPFGLGVSGGVGIIGIGVSKGGANNVGGEAGGGISDLGLRYHFKNGLALSTTVDFQSSPVPYADFLYGINVGLGYEF